MRFRIRRLAAVWPRVLYCVGFQVLLFLLFLFFTFTGALNQGKRTDSLVYEEKIRNVAFLFYLPTSIFSLADD